MALALPVLTSEARGDEVTLALRIAWGGGAERIWRGTISLSDGRLWDLKPLGIEADEPGSIWLEAAQIRIRQPSPRAYDGVDVKVTADSDARLTIWLSNEKASTAKTLQISLRDLVGGQPTHTVLDDVENRLFVSRAPGDQLRVEFDRDHLVFAPGESFTFQVQPYLIPTGTAGLRLLANITTSPGDERVWQHDYTTGDEGTATSITIPVPPKEGVYNLSITAAQPSSIKQGLWRQKPVARRKIQFVVVNQQAEPQPGDGPTDRVVEINPVNPRWWERFANLPLFGGFPKGPLGNGDAATWNHPTLGPMVQLGPGGEAPEVSWEAYPLPIDNPGQVHVLEIEYPSDVPQTMGVSLLEPNAAGAVMPIGLDSGVYVSEEQADGPPRRAKHRVLFWPKTPTPLLLLTNRRPGSQAVYGKIKVMSAAPAQFAMLKRGRRASGGLPPAFADDIRPQRLWAGYLDRPLVPENFGAPEALDRQSFRSLDDWNTFRQGGIRLVRYLKHVGFGGLMLSVLADGSTIYPSRMLEPTPRYDTGAFFASGQDPRRKDALELFFRLFDREQLVLIPALQFAAPLPELEAIKRAGGAEAEGIEWIGPDGQKWLASGRARNGLAPYYNLLDPRVQQAMFNVVEEVAARYSRHESFGGLALQLSPDGYAQLPGENWGYDDQTIARFQRDTQLRVPGNGPGRFDHRARFLAGPGREAWIAWRAGVVADFHRRLEREIDARHPGAKLYLAGGTLLEDRQTQQRLRPTLPRRNGIEGAIKELGIDVEAYRADSHMVLLQPRLLRPPANPLVEQFLHSAIYRSEEMDRLFAGMAQRGSLFYHEPQKARVASFDAVSPFGAANTYTWLVSQMSPSGASNRRRFVHSLATSDALEMFDGGWLLALGQEQSLLDLVGVYRQLPAGEFESTVAETQPVTIRRLSRGGQTFVYLVNDSPWPVAVAMQLEAPPNCRLERIGESPGVGPLVPSGTLTTWAVSLRPYDLAAARFSAPNVQILNPSVTVPGEARLALEARIADLVARVAASGKPQPLGVIDNPGFELPAAGEQMAGWTASAAMGGRVGLDSAIKYSGQQSIRLSGSGQRVSIASAGFDPPTTGRLAVEVRLRTADVRRPPSLRIAVEGETREGLFIKHGIIQRVGEQAPRPGGWVPYSFQVKNVPGEGLSNLRVRFELQGAGDVWIDEVRLFDLWFDDDERLELGKLASLASLHLEKREFADCVRLLEGYWPRYLVANVPLSPAKGPVARRPQPAAPPPEPPKKKPGMLDSIRNIFR